MTEEYLTDDEQLEAVKRLPVESAPCLRGGVLVGAALFFGIRYYQSYTNERAYKAASQFGAMTNALEANDHAKSRQIAGDLIKDYVNSPYADQAQLTLARLDIDEGQLDKAIAPLTRVMDDSKDSELRLIGRLRLGRILTDRGKADEAIKTLATPMPAGFAARYHEVRGDAYLAKKDVPGAINEYQAALVAAELNGTNGALLELSFQNLGPPAARVARAISQGH